MITIVELMRLSRQGLYLFWLLLIAAGLSSCNTTKFLDDESYLLVKNDIKFRNAKDLNNRGKVKYELSTLYQQKPNTNFFFIPREWVYFQNQDPGDTTKFNKWQKRVLAEPPAIFDAGLAQATAESMQRYLQYQGYYNAKVYYDDVVRNKKISITYYVEPSNRLLIDSTFFFSQDPQVDSVLGRIKENSFLEPGAGLAGGLYEREKDRITKYLRNNGFAFFLPNFVAPLEADTTIHPNKANVYLEVLPPSRDSLHQVFHVGQVTVFTDFDPLRADTSLIDTLIDGVLFRSPFSPEVKYQTMLNAVYLHEGDLYREENFNKTNRALSSLGVFRFVRIKQETAQGDSSLLHFRIELTTNPKLEVGADFEINYTNRNTATAAGSFTGNLLGISISPSFRYRNLFHGAELLISNITAGLEFNPSPRAFFWNTVDLRLQNQLYFPRFIDYLGIWKGVNRILYSPQKRQEQQDFFTELREGAAMRLAASYNYLLLRNFYSYNLVNVNYGFDLQRSGTHRYLINHIGIDYLEPQIEPDFDTLLRSNPFLQRSFGQQLFFSLLFRDFNFLYNSRPNPLGRSNFVGLNLEVAGAEVWAANKLYNAITSTTDTLRIGETSFSQYARAEIDLRHYRPVAGRSTLATRFALGIALPFGNTTDVPYVKQFFIGGPNSIRAWPARSLGPGGYEDSTYNVYEVDNPLLFFQTGNLKLEFNVEYRFDLLWRFKGALFLDGGNIWTLRNDPARCGAQFLFSRAASSPCAEDTRSRQAPFYQQIALGSGFGVRLDLTYFILRLDLGIRLRNPYPLRQGNGSVREADYWSDLRRLSLGEANWNIGLGYPF